MTAMRLKRPKRRLLIIGLDGVPIELLREYTRDGTMPVLKELLSHCPPVAMTASLPEISAVSWSGFMTGMDSGDHGIFGFTDLEDNSYRLRFPDFRDLRRKPFFMMGGKPSVIINLPATYPARPMRGALISGFVAPDLERAVWPPDLYPRVRDSGYVIDLECSRVQEEPEVFFSNLHTVLRHRLDLAVNLMRDLEWETFMFTVTGTDRLHHFFFDAWNRDDHPRHKEFRDYYVELDASLGELLEEARRCIHPEWLILSDHGFAPLKTEINLNPLLREWGYAEKEVPDPEGITVPVRKSRVFALDPSRIYIHSKERYPEGRVAPAERKRILEEMIPRFASIRHENRPVIRSVHRREDIYARPYRHLAPDLVLEAEPGFDLKAGFSKSSVFCKGKFRGSHQRDNAFLACSMPEFMPRNPSIFQVRDLVDKMLKQRT